jgi:hypothetical protein
MEPEEGLGLIYALRSPEILQATIAMWIMPISLSIAQDPIPTSAGLSFV